MRVDINIHCKEITTNITRGADLSEKESTVNTRTAVYIISIYNKTLLEKFRKQAVKRNALIYTFREFQIIEYRYMKYTVYTIYREEFLLGKTRNIEKS